ncbi:MAG: ATP-binding cassette domain-containing protein [Culicoidibacterales bacterium]
MAMLEIQQLSKRFGTNQIIDNLSLRVEPGTIYGFIGQNGAGKTTTMKMILGLLAPDNGTILVNGERVSYGANQTNRYIGYLADVPEFYGYMSAKEYLFLCAEVTGMKRASAHERIQALLDLVGLGQTKQRIQGYSRGMKQRLGIAQALLNQPKLLICDEPTSALDPLGRKEILDILAAVKSETTIIFSTHILADVERICDNVGFLHQGRLILEGSVEQLKAQRQSDQFELEFATIEHCQQFVKGYQGGKQVTPTLITFAAQEIARVLQVCVQTNVQPQRLERLEPSLEALFLEVVGQ